MPDEAAHAGKDETRREAQWRDSDVKRAIAAAEEAGLSLYRVEIAPDGTISIVVGSPPETAEPSAPAADR